MSARRVLDHTSIDDPKQWRDILVLQLMITADEFWACVDDGKVPERGADGRGLDGQAEPEPVQPLSPSLARGLQDHLGLGGGDLEGISQEQGEGMLNQYWQDVAVRSAEARPPEDS